MKKSKLLWPIIGAIVFGFLPLLLGAVFEKNGDYDYLVWDTAKLLFWVADFESSIMSKMSS